MGLQFLWWDDPRCPRRRSLPSMFPMQQAPLCPERKSFIIFVCRFHQSIIAYLKHFSQPQRTIRIGRGRFSVVISADCVSVDLGRERIIMTDRRRFSLAHSASRSVFGISDHGPIDYLGYIQKSKLFSSKLGPCLLLLFSPVLFCSNLIFTMELEECDKVRAFSTKVSSSTSNEFLLRSNG